MKLRKILAGAIMFLALTSSVFAAKAKKLKVVTTIFPEYDWVREIVGENNKNVDLTLLVGNGVDLHSYQPSIQDIAKISTADIFIYVGGESDGWVKDALANATNKNMKVINLMEVLEGQTKVEEMKEGMQVSEHHHHHDEDDDDEHHHHEKKATPEDRSINDYQGEWQSLFPYMSNNFKSKTASYMAAAEGFDKEDEAWNFFYEGNKTDIRFVTIKNDKVTFEYTDGSKVSGKYKYDGFYSDCWGETSIRYQFKNTDKKSKAPLYIQFDDHLNFPTKAEHFHIYCGQDAKKMLDIKYNWPTYYPKSIDSEEEMIHEFLKHYINDEEDEHDHHHSKEVSTFEDHEVKDRSLSDWEGNWQSPYPLVLDGTLDHAWEEKAESGNMTAEEYKEYYKTGYKTDIASVSIKGNQITFKYDNGKTAKSKYKYVGFFIQLWSGGTKAAMYRFESTTKKSDAPRFIEINDHMIEPSKAEHFHIRMSNESFDAIEDPEKYWPTFFPAEMTGHEIAEHLAGGHKHNDEEAEDHDHDHEAEGHHHHHHDGETEYDEHVWLSVRFAKTLCAVISKALCDVDSANSSSYKANLKAYTEKLDNLDAKFSTAVKNGNKKTLLFGDRFPFRYFVEDYNLDYYAAFVGCSAETEASFETVAFLAKKVDELGLNSVIKIESGDGKIARTIVENSKKKNAKVLTLDSIQSTTLKQAKAGASYLKIMEENLKIIEEALK